MKAIAAVDRNWAIGYRDRLLVSIPEDMKFFRETTKGHVVVMGRKTLESFPGGNPLKNRVNIVFTGSPDYEKEGAEIVHGTEELMEVLKQYPGQDVFVIGGGSIYRMLLPLCDTAYITKIDHAYPADTFFPDLDADPQWEEARSSEWFTHEDLRYAFVVYRRISGGEDR